LNKNPLLADNTLHVSILTSSDPTRIRDDIEVLDQDVINLSNKPFLVKRVIVNLENITLVFQYSSHRLKTHTKVHPDLVAFVSIGQRSRGTTDGITMRPDMLISAAPGAEVDIIVAPGYRSISLLISPDHLQKLIAQSDNSSPYNIPEKLDFRAVAGSGIQALFKLGMQITTIAEKNQRIFNDNKSARISAEMEILECLTSVLINTTDNEIKSSARDRTRANYVQIINTVETYTLANTDRRIYVSELCNITGISERTLQGVFHEIMQMPPTAYLNRLRLHRARRALRSGTSSTTTVSNVALD
jgi:AraC family ethanolamine operon transcriptional activator